MLFVGVALASVGLAVLRLTFPDGVPHAEVPGNIDGCGGPCAPALDTAAWLGLALAVLSVVTGSVAVAYGVRRRRPRSDPDVQTEPPPRDVGA